MNFKIMMKSGSKQNSKKKNFLSKKNYLEAGKKKTPLPKKPRLNIKHKNCLGISIITRRLKSVMKFFLRFHLFHLKKKKN